MKALQIHTQKLSYVVNYLSTHPGSPRSLAEEVSASLLTAHHAKAATTLPQHNQHLYMALHNTDKPTQNRLAGAAISHCTVRQTLHLEYGTFCLL